MSDQKAMATDELTALEVGVALARQYVADIAAVKKHEAALRADRDRLREENKRNANELDRVAADHSRAINDLAKLREEIAAKDAEIQRLKLVLEQACPADPRLKMQGMSYADKVKLQGMCAPMEDWRGANEDGRKR